MPTYSALSCGGAEFTLSCGGIAPKKCWNGPASRRSLGGRQRPPCRGVRLAVLRVTARGTGAVFLLQSLAEAGARCENERDGKLLAASRARVRVVLGQCRHGADLSPGPLSSTPTR
jgi:hypothetical protein